MLIQKQFRFFVLLVVLALGASGYYLAGPSFPPVESSPEPGPVAVAHNSSPEEAVVEEEQVFAVRDVVKKGETAAQLLQAFLSAGEIHRFSESVSDIFPLRRMRQGQPYILETRDGGFLRFTYEINAERRLIVERGDDPGTFVPRLEDIEYDIEIARVRGSITSHLFGAVGEAGEKPALAVSLAEIFAWEINFIRDLQPGDSFSLLVEKRYRNGEFTGYGRILAATFINSGTVFDAYRFRDEDGAPHYFTGKGESVQRAFLKAPLSFTRISSTFSPNRLHPVLNVWRAHPGIDYAAPTGTPVKAVGAGTVTFKGWGKGAGNYVAIRHNNGYETMYLHLSGFAAGLDKGKKVTQGEVIGFVGSTGYATGPHLDFRMKKDGQYINPLALQSPRTEAVSLGARPEFDLLVATMRAQLDDNIQRADAGQELHSSATLLDRSR